MNFILIIRQINYNKKITILIYFDIEKKLFSDVLFCVSIETCLKTT